MKTRKILLLSAAMLLSRGASAQTPTGAWNAYEDDDISHANPTVLYKRGSDPSNPIYIIPAWDKRITDNGSVRARKITADGSKGAIVTAMGVLYDENGTAGFNGQFSAPLQVWCEKTQEWLNVDAQLLNSLTYADLFDGGASAVYVFKDTRNYDFSETGVVSQVQQVTGTNYTIPTSVTWLGTAGTGTITELGPYAYGNATFSSPTSNKYCRSAFKNLTIPSTITKIGEYAFRGINTLEKVTFEDGGTLSAIPHNCFEACRYLNTATLSSSINDLGGAAFGGCSRLNKLVFTSEAAPTLSTFAGKDPFQKVLTSTDVSELQPNQCIIEVPLHAAKKYVDSNTRFKQFPMSSKFPMSYNMITYCSDLEFTFKQYDTSSKTWSDGSLQVYYVEDGDITRGKVMMTEITDSKKIPSNTFGVLLRGTQNETYDIFYPNNLISNTFSPTHSNCLIGVVTPETITPQEGSAYYVLSADGKFHRVKTAGTLGANKAYLFDEDGGSITIDTGAMSVTLPGDETGIEILLVEDEADDAVYTLQGTKVSPSHKGLVIQNGKKYIVR